MRFALLLILALAVGPAESQNAAKAPLELGISQNKPVSDQPERDEWLYGTWQLTYDPDNNPTDWIIFAVDGSVSVKRPDGRLISGTYTRVGSSLTVTVSINSKAISFPLKVSPDRTQIANESGAYYTKSHSGM